MNYRQEEMPNSAAPKDNKQPEVDRIKIVSNMDKSNKRLNYQEASWGLNNRKNLIVCLVNDSRGRLIPMNSLTPRRQFQGPKWEF